ncbi:MAG: mandelate racemase/muconate lactonizing enzyme family protein [Ilumatobacteraceae bacterium]|nr:mandelate racemase/muconate lactonizing enzyme family protein [Ilumatobacteraceae bacterium]
MSDEPPPATAPTGPLGVEIVDAEVLHVRKALEHPAGPAGASNAWRESTFLKLTTDDGTVGWGETYSVAGTPARLRQVAETLIGTPLAAIGGWPPPFGLDEVGDSFVLGAIDIARHDLIGSILGVPAHALLGPQRRTTVQAYASGFLYRQGSDPAGHWLDEAQQLVDAGYRSIKVRIGGLDVDEELDRLTAIRELVPTGTTLMVDAWGAYTPATAMRVGDRLYDLGVVWFEEPCPPGPDCAGYEGLVTSMRVPIAGGEAARTRSALLSLLQRRAVDVIQPDAAICGGMTNVMFAAELAVLHGLSCVPHTWNGGVMAAATMHVLAAMPLTGRIADGTGPWLEYDTTENAFLRGALVDPPHLIDGSFPIPDGPGLGVEVDEAFLRAHLVDA